MDDNLLSDFLAECREHLEGIETDLLAIEEAGESADKDLINKVFRAAHSIKGGSGFFQLDKVKNLAHSLETVLDMIRSKKMIPQAEIINILLLGFDKLREMVNNIDNLNQYDISSNIESLQSLVTQHQSKDEKGSIHREIKLTSSDGLHSATILEVDAQAAHKEQQFIYLIEYDLIHDMDRKGRSPVELLKSLSSMGVIIDTIFDVASVGTLDDEPVNTLPLELIYRTVIEPALISEIEEIGSKKIYILDSPIKGSNQSVTTSQAKDQGPKVNEKKQEDVTDMQKKENINEIKTEIVKQDTTPDSKHEEEKNNKSQTTSAPETLRINVEALDTLMAHAGELVLSRNQLVDAISRADSKAISASAQRISFVISELQEAVMQTRLQPVSNVFNKFPRVVRDLSIILKKELRLMLEGKDVELDKTIIEGLSDPLNHMVRNAADHGIESHDERIKKGKPAVGTISLRAYHEAGHVVIEIEDDGKGIDSEKVANKALEMGLITQEKLKGMSESDKISLIFLPGLSTAEKLTETSGRGVGMDVVKTNLDRLGGKVTIRSEIGKGTIFCIKLPLTLAIIPSLIISEENEKFAIPQVNVVELLRIPAAQVKDRIKVVGDAEVVVLRGDLIPIVRFSNILGITNTYLDPNTENNEVDRRNRIADRRSQRIDADGVIEETDLEEIEKRSGADRRYHASSDLNIVIIASGLLQYGLVVDQLHNSEEIVVKPLGRHLKGLQEYAGATIMGNGEVALILDATGIAVKANLSSVSNSSNKEKNSEDSNAAMNEGIQSLLIFNNQLNEQCAMPLDLVQRVENIAPNQIEMKGGRRTMQYRGASLPLVQLSDVAQVQPIPESEDVAVVVTSVAGHTVGLLGLMPVSVVETELNIDSVTHRQQGISGSVIIGEKTVLIVDIYEIIDIIHPEWSVEKKKNKTSDTTTILLAEDSDFFRGQIEKYISDSGFNVISAKDGKDAWDLLESNEEKVQILITDIEMPRMTGLELCKKIRGDSRFSTIPVIALSSLASDEDTARGKEAGITDYQVKLDRDRLIESINNILKSN